MGAFALTSQHLAELVAAGTNLLASLIEIVGVVTILIALVVGLGPYALALLQRRPAPPVAEVRRRLGRGLVFSLEIFVAADLLRTLPHPDLPTIEVLGVIAILRVVLGLGLEYEIRHLPDAGSSLSGG